MTQQSSHSALGETQHSANHPSGIRDGMTDEPKRVPAKVMVENELISRTVPTHFIRVRQRSERLNGVRIS